MEIFKTIEPSYALVPAAASNAALVALPCAASALRTDVQGIAVRTAWSAAVATDVVAAKRERTAAGTGMGHGFDVTFPGSLAWSPPL